MASQKINLIQLNWRGEVNNCSGQIGFSADPKLIAAQKKAKAGTEGAKIARWLIAGKIEASILLLKNCIPNSEFRAAAITRHERRLAEIRNPRNSISISQLLGIEGDCAQGYFRAWHGLPIKWSGTKRRPVPNNWFEVAPHTIVWKKRAYVARHPVNAMLNYGYGILISSIQTQIIVTGLDPTVGIIHGNKNPTPLVYDLVEPLRPAVDQAIIEFALGHTFTPGDFTINNFGGCRLNPHMAVVVARKVSGLECDWVVEGLLKRLMV
jgi:CRISPR-associated endonuclease Cas1